MTGLLYAVNLLGKVFQLPPLLFTIQASLLLPRCWGSCDASLRHHWLRSAPTKAMHFKYSLHRFQTPKIAKITCRCMQFLNNLFRSSELPTEFLLDFAWWYSWYLKGKHITCHNNFRHGKLTRFVCILFLNYFSNLTLIFLNSYIILWEKSPWAAANNDTYPSSYEGAYRYLWLVSLQSQRATKKTFRA